MESATDVVTIFARSSGAHIQQLHQRPPDDAIPLRNGARFQFIGVPLHGVESGNVRPVDIT
jgi:hypothetical protein